MEIAMTHIGMASFVGVVALMVASAQGAIGQPVAMVAVLGALGILGAAGALSRKPERVRVKAETKVPPARRNS
jgi:hypothetical protein